MPAADSSAFNCILFFQQPNILQTQCCYCAGDGSKSHCSECSAAAVGGGCRLCSVPALQAGTQPDRPAHNTAVDLLALCAGRAALQKLNPPAARVTNSASSLEKCSLTLYCESRLVWLLFQQRKYIEYIIECLLWYAVKTKKALLSYYHAVGLHSGCTTLGMLQHALRRELVFVLLLLKVVHVLLALKKNTKKFEK